MMRFYVSMECDGDDGCGETIYHGPVGTLIEHKGLPVISFDIAAQEVFECDNCGRTYTTGDFDVWDQP